MKEIINMLRKPQVSQKLENEIKKTKFKTITPVNGLSFEQWCIEFKVSMRHGKSVTYIG